MADQQEPEKSPTSDGNQKKTLADLKGIDFDLGFYCGIAFKAAVELRTALKIDEATFRKIDLSAWPDPRPAFIYRVLDEIQKAGLCITEWYDKVKDDSTPDASDHEIRLNHQWLLDEQNFRARKLTEVLVDLICFSDTNEPEYYRDYLRLHELNATVNVLKDQDKFYGFRRRNYEYGVGLKARSIVAGEAKLDVRKRWYLKEPPGLFQDGWKTRGVDFRSFRQKYIHSLGLAVSSEVAMLGKSYMLTYGRMSSDIHFTPQEIWKFNPKAVEVGFINVGMLCFEILIRCQRLLDIVPDGLNANLRKIHDENTGPAEIVADLKREKAKVGDLVRTKERYICEVMQISRSKLGYVSYLLRYLEHPPIPEIKEDWFAGFEIRLIDETNPRRG
ncbi:MAG TPA: hypothetical protein VGF82_05400 [Terracidiphilus sp.]